MSMEYIRNHFKVPAKRGLMVEYWAWDGEQVRGTIVASDGSYLKVRLGDNKETTRMHPTYNLIYLTNPPYDPTDGKQQSRYDDEQ